MKKVTAFGKALRKLRLDRDELLADMAQALECSSAYLSSIELGKKSIPLKLVDRVADLYELDHGAKSDLRDDAERSQPHHKIELGSASEIERELAACFARDFKNVGEQRQKAILSLLKEKRDDEQCKG